MVTLVRPSRSGGQGLAEPVVLAVLSAVVGAGNAGCAAWDSQAGAIHGRLTTIYQTGLIATGAILDLADGPELLADACLYGGTALASRRVAFPFSVSPEPGT